MEKTFTREELLDLGLPYSCDGGKIISRTILGQRRWVTEYELVFQLAGQPDNEAWRCYYDKGSTEQQEQQPWEDETTVECSLVRKTEKTVTVWE